MGTSPREDSGPWNSLGQEVWWGWGLCRDRDLCPGQRSLGGTGLDSQKLLGGALQGHRTGRSTAGWGRQ